MRHGLPLQVIPGHRNAVNPEPMNTGFAEHARTPETTFLRSLFMGSRVRGNDLWRR